MLMNLRTLQWDPELCAFFGVEPWLLPAIRSSAEVYGIVHPSHGALAGVPIAGVRVDVMMPCCSARPITLTNARGSRVALIGFQCAGDQQAALLGHRCLRTGEAKNTYGTGCFLLFNTGTVPVISRHGLISTVAYQLGPSQPAHYALEVRFAWLWVSSHTLYSHGGAPPRMRGLLRIGIGGDCRRCDVVAAGQPQDPANLRRHW